MARQHLHALSRLKTRAVPVGVYDRAADAAEALASAAGTRAFRSMEELFASVRPDVVHVCTPPSAHFAAARAALDAGAHVYVEKPFALKTIDARRLLDAAARRGVLVCAGHQLLRDPAFEQVMARAPELGTLVQVDSHFAFRPTGASARGGARALAEQIVDILPHPLYALVAVLERCAPPAVTLDVVGVHAGPADLHATLRAGEIVGRLSVSLRARPIASSLSLIGTGGLLTCDFVRSTVVGAANPGTEILEKIANPILEGAQLVGRTALRLPARLRGGYPGLAELIDAFYAAIVHRGPSPVSPEHLVRVTGLLETFVTEVERAVNGGGRTAVLGTTARPAPVTVVTGANGFLGSRIVRSLESVRGIGRSSAAPDDGPAGMPWVAADLSRSVPVAALAGAEVVIHAAAETAGDFDAHQRNTIDATRHLLQAMHASGVSRLVLVSSLSVVRPPRSLWECQDESTPRPADAARLGPYTWGKTSQEALVEREAAALGIATRIVRPGALVDAARPEVPGLLGRRVFGRWHLGLGRPSLPIAACDVDRCARAIAWCATHFDDAPPIVNLFEPSTATRGALAAWMRARGWNGRIVWIPISVIAAGMSAARGALALAHGRRPSRLAVWSILRARRFDPHVSAALLAASDGLRCHTAPNTTVPAIAGYRSGSSVALGEPT